MWETFTIIIVTNPGHVILDQPTWDSGTGLQSSSRGEQEPRKMNQSSDLIELSELAAVCARDLGDPIAQAESMVLETLGGEAPFCSAVTGDRPRTHSTWRPST